jgi:hypothetical protein
LEPVSTEKVSETKATSSETANGEPLQPQEPSVATNEVESEETKIVQETVSEKKEKEMIEKPEPVEEMPAEKIEEPLDDIEDIDLDSL